MTWDQSCISISAYLDHRFHLFSCDADLHQNVLHLLRVVWLLLSPLTLTARSPRCASCPSLCTKDARIPNEWRSSESGFDGREIWCAGNTNRASSGVSAMCLGWFVAEIWDAWDYITSHDRMIIINWKECGSTWILCFADRTAWYDSRQTTTWRTIILCNTFSLIFCWPCISIYLS